MNAQPLNHADAKDAFAALIDQELPPAEEAQVRGHLADCESCLKRWTKYERTVTRVRQLERVRAPEALATKILQRARRRRGPKLLAKVHTDYRLPVEILIPILIAAAVAAWLGFLA